MRNSTAMDYARSYAPSEIAHTVARSGDTSKWTSSLSPLLDVEQIISLKLRELVRLDQIILEVELKKATVSNEELQNNPSFRNTLAQIASRPAEQLPENRRWHFKERATKLCLYFYGSTTETVVNDMHEHFYHPAHDAEKYVEKQWL